MDFNEYEYLEKSVEDPEIRKEKEHRSSRRRRDHENGEKDDGRTTKRPKSEQQNGEGRDRQDRDHSSRSEKDHRRGSRDAEREHDKDRDRSRRNRERDNPEREREKERERERERESGRETERAREREKEHSRRSGSRSGRHEREVDTEMERARSREREKEHSRRSGSRSGRHEREVDIEMERARSREREKEHSRRSGSRSGRHEREVDTEMERARSRETAAKEIESERDLLERESRRLKEKKELEEPEADPERDQSTVFAYQMSLKATDRDVYEFFSKAGKVRDVRLIMDRNSRRSKGVGYIEFYDAMSVEMAINLSGQCLFGQPVMVKRSEAEKNLVQSNAAGGSSSLAGAGGRKLYVGNLHFNMTENQLRQVFEPFGPVELVQLPLDLETQHCKGFGFVQFVKLEHAVAAQSLNGKVEIAGRIIKVSAVTDNFGVQDAGANAADFDDDDGGFLPFNAQSRAILMQKLDRTGTASSIAESLGVPLFSGAAPNPQALGAPMNGQAAVPVALQTMLASPVIKFIGNPSECILLKNMFDPNSETDPDFDLDIKEEVQEECSKFGPVKHIYVEKNSQGYVYLQFDSVDAAARCQDAMHMRWFACRPISATFMQAHEYEAKFKSGV